MNENTLQEELNAVEVKLAAERDLGAQRDADKIATLEVEQARLLEAISQEEQQAAQMVRIQAQEERVATIELPHDFNEAFDDPRANEIIIEVVKEFQRKANAENNAEVETLVAQHREDLRAAADRELQLKRQNDELQASVSESSVQIAELQQSVMILTNERDDALSKRDAAVREKEGLEALLAEKQAHIEKLRDEAAIGASRAINVTAIEASDRLSQLVKESAAEKANRALARWADVIEVQPVVVAPPIAPEVPTFQPGDTQADISTDSMDQTGPIPIPADHQEVTFRADEGTVSPEVQVVERNAAAPVARETVTRAEFEALKTLVKECCLACDVDVADVA